MQLRAEFTTEPFEGEGDPPGHAVAALKAAERPGIASDFGPLGTRLTGEADAVLNAVHDVMSAALSSGATRVTMQVEVDDRGDGDA